MNLNVLQDKIDNKRALVAVIGLGYVGLPVACTVAQAGFNVLGVDTRQEIIRKVNLGTSPIQGKEPGLAELLQGVVKSGRLRATDDYHQLSERDIVLIAVETPVDRHNKPRYQALRTALTQLGPVLKSGALVIIESTLAPGTINSLAIPTLEQSASLQLNRDFYIGHCPERVMP